MYYRATLPSQVGRPVLSATIQLCHKAAQTSTSLKQGFFAQPVFIVVIFATAELEVPCFSPITRADPLVYTCRQHHIPTAQALPKLTPTALRLHSTAVLSGELCSHLALIPSLSNILLAAVLLTLFGGTQYRRVILSSQSF